MAFERLRTRAKGVVRRLALRIARLRWRLPSELLIEVRDHSDWVVYNDLFVDGEYDAPLYHLLEAAPRGPWRVFDLGANVGFFVHRLADLALRRGLPLEALALTAIEGHPRIFRELERRVGANPAVRAQVRLLHGLVGERSGSGRIEDSGFSAMARVTGGAHGAAVSYIDILTLLSAGERLDLLKCDIEGAEQRFLECYPDLLARVDAAIFEFHLDRCDLEACHAHFVAAGLTSFETLSQRGGLAVRWYRRQRSSVSARHAGSFEDGAEAV